MASKQSASLPERLRQIIRDSELSNYALADKSGVAEEVIRRFMNGTRDLRLETAGRLTDALEVDLVVAKRGRRGR